MNAVLNQDKHLWTGGLGGKYWQQSRRPLVSLAFILPLLALYEGGVLLLGPSAIRNGADVWLRQLLDQLGLGSYFLLPLLTVAVLMAWHHTSRQPWKVSAGVLYGMMLESALLGLGLLLLAHVQGVLLQQMLPTVMLATSSTEQHDALQILSLLIGFSGAGVYEEVLFRLLLLPVVAGLLGWLGAPQAWRIGGAVVTTSLVFSLAHYIGPYGDAWHWFTFTFRFLAGGFFAIVFVQRGFGIAAGAHALYDIFVGIRM